MMRHPKAELDAYIDDFQIVITGTRMKVMQWAADALIDLDCIIQDETKCSLHEEKACITATDPLLANAIRRLVGARIGGPRKPHAESLGIDLQGGRKRCTWDAHAKQWARLARMRQKAVRQKETLRRGW